MSVLDNSIYIAGTSDAYGKANDIVLIKRDYATGDTIWTRHYNGSASADDQAVDMVINQTTGEIYVTGKTTGLSTGYDVVTLKYSAKGVLGWTKRWDNKNYHGDDIPRSIGIDNSGNVTIVGITYNGKYNLNDILRLRYDSQGNILIGEGTDYLLRTDFDYNLWDNRVYYSNENTGAAKVSNNGQVYITGDYLIGSASNGYSVVFSYGFKVNDYGFPQSIYDQRDISGYSGYFTPLPLGTTISTPDDFNLFNAMDLDNSNNVYLAYLNDTIQGNGNGYRVCIAKINGSGSVVWERKVSKNSSAKNIGVKSIKVDSNGNVYAAGFEKNSSGNLDWFVIKYNSSGVFQWRVTKKGTGNGDDIPNDIAFDSLQNPVVVGVTKNTGTNNDITFVKYNKTNGAELFSVNYDSANGDEKAYNVIVDASQRIIINGIVNTATQGQNMITLMYCNTPATPTISVNGNALHSDATNGNQWYNKNGIIIGATTQDYTPKTSGDYYVIVSVNGCSSNSSKTLNFIPTGIAPNESAKTIKVYPNPVTNELTIELEGNISQINFEIINSSGQTVFNGVVVERTIVQTRNFASGAYVIKLQSGKTFEFKKIIKN